MAHFQFLFRGKGLAAWRRLESHLRDVTFKLPSSRRKRTPFVRHLCLLGLLTSIPWVAWAQDDALKLSGRGIKAYQLGRLAMAKSYFERALGDAELRGRPDWVAMSAANLVDLLLEIHEVEQAENTLRGLSTIPPDHQALIFWKQSQIAAASGKLELALALVDSAALRSDKALSHRIEMDKLHYRLMAGDTAGLWSLALKLNPDASSTLRSGWLALLGEIQFKASDAAKAESLFNMAAIRYRQEGRFARAADLLLRRANALAMANRHHEALASLREAAAMHLQLGLKAPVLNHELMVLLLGGDSSGVAKAKRAMDLESTGPVTRDVQELDDESATRVAAPPPSAPGLGP